MLDINNAVKEHRLIDYIYEDDQIKTLSDWLLIELLKMTLKSIDLNCSSELIDIIMESIKEQYILMERNRNKKFLNEKELNKYMENWLNDK